MTPAEVQAAANGYKQRVDFEAWLTGRYVLEALSAPLSSVFGRKGNPPYRYPSSPRGQQEAPQGHTGEQEKKDRLKAELYMRQMVAAGKNWGKNNSKVVT